MIVRPADSADWLQIWPIFQAVVNAGDSYAYPEDCTSDEGRLLWMERPPGLTVVASDDTMILGTAKMGPNRPGRGSHVATASFMVDPNSRGQGVGRALAEFSLKWAREAGFRSMQFNAVVETNEPAVKLWQALGFEVLTTVPEAFNHATYGLVGLHVMHRRL